MPLYEYRCECEKGREILLSFKDADQPQICECGKVMQRLMSASSFVMKQIGNQMALDTLNSKQGMPNKWWKSGAEKVAAAGL